ncbi:MAG TPA: efflux RND transporter periplasmic adaptor subunit [Bryobacteraceae bacterium]|nr:efflux RND transporter periplasmic adaptor subunit [Bryobacteraceae bacterium]
MRSHTWLFPITGVVPLAVALVSSGCGTATSAKAPDVSPQEAPTVAVAKATLQNLSHTLVLTAEFNPYQEIDVMAKVAGYIKQINVDIGDRVRQGQLLATLEIPEMADELNRAKASLQRSQAQVAQARDEINRAQSGYDIAHLSFQRLDNVMKTRPGLVAQQDVDDAQAKETSAAAQVSAAKSNLAAAQEQVSVSKAEMDKIQTLYEYTRVTAPFDGVITKRYANTGSMIQAGTASQTQAMPVVRLSQNNLLRLILPVPESAVPTVHIGQQVDVRVPTLNRTFPGKVARFADKLSLATRTMDTEVDVPNPKLVLIPGMYAEVDLTLNQANNALAVPVTAVDLASDAEGAGKPGPASGAVMVVTPQNRLEARKVAVGMETANRIEIRSGLQDGEMVVIGNRAGLQAGQEVRPKVTELTAEK